LAAQWLAGWVIETLVGPAERDAVLASVAPVRCDLITSYELFASF